MNCDILLRMRHALRVQALLVLASTGAFAIDCQRSGPDGRTAFCVQFAMKQGKIAVGEHALSEISPTLKTALRSPTADELDKYAVDRLEEALAPLPKPYPGLPDIADLTATWTEFTGKLGPHLTDGTAVIDPIDPAGILNGLAHLSQDCGVFFVTGSYAPDEGSARFEILEPFLSSGDGTRPVALSLTRPLTPTRTARRIRDLRRELRSFDGRLWCGKCYVDPIQSYYDRRELSAQVMTGQGENNSIAVLEGMRVSAIDLSGVEPGDVEAVAWAVLSTSDFEKWRKLPRATPPGTILLKEQLGYTTATLPYLVQAQIELQQLALAQNGYAFGQPQPLDQGELKLVVQSVSDAKPQEGAPAAARPTVDPKAGITGPQANVSEQEPGANLKKNPEAVPAKLTRYIAPGFEYRPGQAVRGFLTGELQNLPKPFPSTLTFTGGYPFGTLGSVNASADFVAMNTIHRPLSLAARASADRTLHRFLNGVKQDELRMGPTGRAELELFRDLGGNLLRVYGEMQHTTVTLTAPSGESKSNLNVLELGGLYWYHSADTELPTWILAKPQLRAGVGLAQGEPTFQTGRMDVQIWQAYRKGFGSFVAVHGAMASKATPLFEAPSLGGADSVRGFRTDDAIGRRTWSAQAEVRIPLAGSGGAAAGSGGMSPAALIRQIKLAPLFDIGGVGQAIGSAPGTRAGAGLGARLKVSFVEFGVDWAYAVMGTAATGGSRGKFYFAIRTILPY